MGVYFDIVVVGAGHAGCEAACAGANLGAKTLLINLTRDGIARMSCNPAVGGIAKGQIVREIDALGGYTGIVADRSMLQFRMLNRSKGPAMWSPRTQNDKNMFISEWTKVLDNTKNLCFIQDEVTSLLLSGNVVIGVNTRIGKEIRCGAVILANGTFLNGRIHIGEVSFSGGRLGELNSVGLSDQLKDFGFEVATLKTGTPVRIDGRSIDFGCLEAQPLDDVEGKFSYSDETVCLPLSRQRHCYMAHTSLRVHEVLKQGFDKSPLFTGRIKGKGPRYCPSIEDKLNRFEGKDKHPLFLEPEGFDNIEYYLNGFSSSLPEEVQYKAIRCIEGFEHAEFIRPGYAIEYDFFQPTQLKSNLETKKISRLFFAGQINGTTGYEEAAAQGLMAGINAFMLLNDREPFVLSRSQSYIGVLIDDLITKGVDEPYRMFTSRAEHRILLRQDNADIRLTPLSHKLGLASDKRNDMVEIKMRHVDMLTSFLTGHKIGSDDFNSYFNTVKITESRAMNRLLSRPDVSINDLANISSELSAFIKSNNIGADVLEQTEIKIKYDNYIVKEESFAERLSELEKIPLRKDIDYSSITTITYESREKLNKIKPDTIGQASRIPGVSPSDIAALLTLLRI